MPKHRVIFALIVAAITLCTASPSAAAGGREPDRRAVVAAEAAWGAAFVTGDAARADELMAEDFGGVDETGGTYGKTVLLRWIRDGPLITSNEPTISSIRFYGQVAVVQGASRILGVAPARTPFRAVWTDVWAKRAGRWRIVASQVIRVGAR